MKRSIVCIIAMILFFILYKYCINYYENYEDEAISKVNGNYKETWGTVVGKEIYYDDTNMGDSISTTSDICIFVYVDDNDLISNTKDKYFDYGANKDNFVICYNTAKEVYDKYEIGDFIKLYYLDGYWGHNERMLARATIGNDKIMYYIFGLVGMLGAVISFVVLIVNINIISDKRKRNLS